MTRSTIATFGPCCRCGQMARHIIVMNGRRAVVHEEPTVTPCPVRQGEMPETGSPQEIH